MVGPQAVRVESALANSAGSVPGQHPQQSARLLKPRTFRALAQRPRSRVPRHRGGPGRTPGSGLLAAEPSGSCSAEAKGTSVCALASVPQGCDDVENTKIRFWCVCVLVADDIYEN